MATISPSQQAFLRNLLVERAETLGLKEGDIDQFIIEQQLTSLTSRSASALIDRIKQIKVVRTGLDHLPEHDRLIVNKYVKPCALCGHPVNVGAGYAVAVKGEWHTYHKKGECPTGERPQLTEVLVNRAYRLKDGTIALTYRTQNGRTAARKLVVVDVPVSGTNPSGKQGSLKYESGLVGRISVEGTLLTEKEASALGRQYSFCVCCAKQLTDERSLVAGYGQVCASHNSWWYPTQKEAVEILKRPASV